MKTKTRFSFASSAIMLCAVFLMGLTCVPSALAQGPIPGTPQQPPSKPGGGGGFGFGLSIDLGSLFKAIQGGNEEKYASPDTAKLPQFEPRQILLSWEPDQSGIQDQVQALLAASGGKVLSQSNLPSLGISIAALVFDTQSQADQALVALQAASPKVTVDRHAMAYPMQTGTAPKGKQFALELIKAQTPAQTRVQTAVVVGVIDTELANADGLVTASFKAKRMFADSDKPAPTDHGSGVAAILAAKSDNGFSGLAQGVHLRAAGVMREVSPGINATNTLLVAQALDWLISENAQVINLSLGSAPDAVLAAAVNKATAQGIVLVAAAGNGGSAAAPSYPAAYPGVIAVTAVDANKQLYTRANRGAYVALAAPGVDVWVPVGKGKYMSGTSFAAPFVAAAIAQKLAANPLPRNPQATQTLLKSLCSSAVVLGATNPSPEFGCGLMQL